MTSATSSSAAWKGEPGRWFAKTTRGLKRPSLQNLLRRGGSDGGNSSWAEHVSSSTSIAARTNTSAHQANALPAHSNAPVAEDTSMSASASANEIGGAPNIDFIGSVSLLLNNVTGGGMVLFAQQFQQSGWLLTCGCLWVLMAASGIIALMFVELLAKMPNNGQLQQRVEYCSVVKHWCSRSIYRATSIFYQLSLTLTNLSLIVQSAQVMDFTIVQMAGRTCALPMVSPSFTFECPDPVTGNITPFDPAVWCLPLGLMMTAVAVIPLGLVNLDSNIKVQKVAFGALLAIVVTWIVLMGLEAPRLDYVPTIGSSFSTLMGTALFNFAFLTSLPSWVAEKRPDVSIGKVLGTVLALAVALFIVIGWLGGCAFVPWSSSETLLEKIKDLGTIGAITFYAFPIIVNLSSIPILSIFQRYNLLSEGVCSKPMANFLAVVLPWLLAIPLYNGSGYQNLVAWGGVIVTSVVNFIVPTAIYIAVIRREQRLLDSLNTETAETSSSAIRTIRKFRDSSLSLSVCCKQPVGDIMLPRDGSQSSLNGLLPTPLSSFSIASTESEVDTDIDSRSGRSTDTLLSHTSMPNIMVALNPQAQRWLREAEHDPARALPPQLLPLSQGDNQPPRDLEQPASGSLRRTNDSGPVSRPFHSHSQLLGSAQRLPSSDTRSAGHDHTPSSAIEMVGTASSAASATARPTATATPVVDALAFLEHEAIAVHEEEVDIELDSTDDEGAKAVAASLPIPPPPAPAAWLAVSRQWDPYRLPVSIGVLVVMVTVCFLALEEQIRGQIDNPGW